MRLASWFVGFALIAAATAGASQGSPSATADSTFYVNDPAKRNQITFKSEAPLEDIIGLSNDITGKVVFNPLRPENGVKAEFSVPAGSFTTGIPMRDEHLASAAWLNAAEHAAINLQVTKINKITMVSRGEHTASFLADITANLTLRGKTNPVNFVARVTHLMEDERTKNKMPGDLLAIRAEFGVSLESFGIKGPDGKGLVGSKVSDDIIISVNLFASNSPEMAEAPSQEKAP
jgi:polyisoprenoid-binding protein YceI